MLSPHRTITRCYLEITNTCNLNCKFCPKTRRPPHRLTQEEFSHLTARLQGHVRFLYFHLMGEPLLHPLLPDFIQQARQQGFIPVITTNGTLLNRTEGLIEAHPHKVQISIHSLEGNDGTQYQSYVQQVMHFAIRAAQAGIIVVLRLWNQGGFDSQNHRLLQLIAQYVPEPWTQRYDGWKLTNGIYIEFDKMFQWPEQENREYDSGEVFCYALRNQLGVLADGTVVPCCLDHDGSIPLGNLYAQSLEEILSSPRAQALVDGFSRHTATESLCKGCGYAAVTKRFRK